MMIKDFFSNIAILVSVLFFYLQVTRKFPLQRSSSIKMKIASGLVGGLLANVLMLYGFQVETTIQDLRHIPTILLVYYGGALPAFIAMLLTIIGRLLVTMNIASYLAAAISLVGVLFSLRIMRTNFSKKAKITSIITFYNILYTIVIAYLLHDGLFVLRVVTMYWLFSYSSVYLSFYVWAYLRKSHTLFDKYKEESITDVLTGLSNKRRFEQLFQILIQDLRRKEKNQQKLALLYIDIDFFKEVNDNYGHAAGDAVLRQLSIRLQDATRAFDIVSRNGGEEFTVLLLDCPLIRATEIAERIRKKVENEPFTINATEKIHLTVSIGVACYQETTDEPESLLHEADIALYKAKHTGRNRVCVAVK